MNTLRILLLALLLTCTATASQTDDERRERKLQTLSPQTVFCLSTNAHQRATYKGDFVYEFDRLLSAACVDRLSGESVKELNRKLDTLKRGSNSHPYTEDELRAALAKKAAAK